MYINDHFHTFCLFLGCKTGASNVRDHRPSRRGALPGGPRRGEAAAGDGHRSRDAAAAAAAARTGDTGDLELVEDIKIQLKMCHGRNRWYNAQDITEDT